jgi:hypothetical protein
VSGWVGFLGFGSGRVGSTRASLFDVSGWVKFWGFGSGPPVPLCLTCRVGFFWVGSGFWALGRVGSARASLFDISGFLGLGRVFGLWVGSGRPVPP